MSSILRPLPILCAAAMLLTTFRAESQNEPSGKGEASPVSPPTVAEATARARLLHASFAGSLAVMHRDFFRKNESRAIPSESLEDVFKVMASDWGVCLNWLAADDTAKNVDHTAKDAFQKEALAKIAAGEKEAIQSDKSGLRFIGSIVLRNECLKCHVKDRQTLEDRFAALEIRMAVKIDPAGPPP